jgi:putative ABC transport system substrate-binding protein
MRRRKFGALVGGATTASAVWPFAARAQQIEMPVIGFLSGAASGPYAPYAGAFRQGLSETGYAEGKNVAVEYRWADGHYDRLPAMAADLVGHKVSVIMASGIPAAHAAKNATSTIPIVFSAGDPVGEGLVASLSRPGGNLTGVSSLSSELEAKRLELLSELVPQTREIFLLVNPSNSRTEHVMRDVQEAARTKGMQLHILKVSSESEIETAFASLVPGRASALVVTTDPFFNTQRAQIVALAARHALPAIYTYREFATDGGLITYGANLKEAYRQAGVYTGQILKGAKPSNLPIQQTTTFELIINLKTAKALGIEIPPSLRQRADEVIE